MRSGLLKNWSVKMMIMRGRPLSNTVSAPTASDPLLEEEEEVVEEVARDYASTSLGSMELVEGSFVPQVMDAGADALELLKQLEGGDGHSGPVDVEEGDLEENEVVVTESAFQTDDEDDS